MFQNRQNKYFESILSPKSFHKKTKARCNFIVFAIILNTLITSIKCIQGQKVLVGQPKLKNLCLNGTPYITHPPTHFYPSSQSVSIF